MDRCEVDAARSWRPRFAIRRDWPDGTHEFVRFGISWSGAEVFIEADRVYWRRGPWRPIHSVVSISRRDFELHRARPRCKAPDCPGSGPARVIPMMLGHPVRLSRPPTRRRRAA